MSSITTDFSRYHAAGLFCSALATMSIGIGYFLFRPLGWRRFLGRSPLFLVTGGVLFLMALADLPEALQSLFERYLGHSIYEMVYERQSSGTGFWPALDELVVGACGGCLRLLDFRKRRMGHRKPGSEARDAVKCAGIIAHLRLDLLHRLGYVDEHTVLTSVARNF